MATYTDLVSQANALMAQAEQVRKQELAGVIADIKAKMTQYGISLQDLGAPGRKSKGGVSKAKAPAKYKGPNGELWSGGPGRKPDWVKQVVASGKDIESFRI
jgi:DNA-binding protein H-NS